MLLIRRLLLRYLAVALLVLGSRFSYATVTAEPAILVFHSATQAETVVLAANGQPVAAEQVKSWRFLVDARNYSHMLLMTPSEEGVRIQPSATAEVGSYTLVMETAEGNAAVQVFLPLTDQQSLIESLAQRMGITVDEVKKQTGVSQRLGHDQITLHLLPVYYLGQRIQIDMPVAENRFACWKVNGNVVQEETDAARLDYTAAETGPLLLTYEERENGVLVTTATALTEIVPEPPILHEIKTNTLLQLQAPPEFSDYVWLLNESQVATGVAFSHKFPDPGKYQVKVKCTKPLTTAPYALREIQYKIHVVSE